MYLMYYNNVWNHPFNSTFEKKDWKSHKILSNPKLTKRKHNTFSGFTYKLIIKLNWIFDAVCIICIVFVCVSVIVCINNQFSIFFSCSVWLRQNYIFISQGITHTFSEQLYLYRNVLYICVYTHNMYVKMKTTGNKKNSKRWTKKMKRNE